MFCRDLYHDREGFLIMEAAGSLRVEEAGFGNENGLRIKLEGLEELTQDSVVFGVSLDGETMDREL